MSRVLIVDDCDAVRGAVRFVLERRPGLEICGEAIDGLDAIEKAKTLLPDLILLDLNMPRLNGAAAAPVLKKISPGVPIMLFTMYEEAIGQLARAEVDLVLSKPAALHQLADKVHDLLAGHASSA